MLNHIFIRTAGCLGNRHVDGVSIVRRLSVWLTRFSFIFAMDKKKGPISLTVFEMKNELRACTFGSRAPATSSKSAELSCACPIFRREKFADPIQYEPSVRPMCIHVRQSAHEIAAKDSHSV